MSEKRNMALRPDAQAFDEVRIVTVPRWKESELSGDEWRISARTEFYRKGELVHEAGASTVDYALQLVAAEAIRAVDNGKGYFASVDGRCDQEGCAEEATVLYRLKKQYCRSGHGEEPRQPTYRQFCKRHAGRGDCGLDDSDANYEQVPR